MSDGATNVPGLADDAPAAVLREPGDAAYAMALAGLPGMGPATLRRLLGAWPARRCWAKLCAGTLDPGLLERSRRRGASGTPLERWAALAAKVEPEREIALAESRGIAVHVLGDGSYPAVLSGDPTAPAVCFTLGDPRRDIMGSSTARVAIVGTRSSTHYGEEVAAELGARLAAEGVTVVSGLAAGIDAAAHEGALVHSDLGPPLAIVGGGVDVVYPACNRRLRSRLAEAGSILSEAPPGTPPERWRFPLRNRLVAAAVDVVVVVEAHRSGGAMHTVDAALVRGVPVAAVPGSVRSAASLGTNALLADGAAMARDSDDVLALLALRRVGRTGPARPERTAGSTAATNREVGSPSISPVTARVLAALGDCPTSIEAVLRRTGLTLGAASTVLEELVSSGWIRREAGGYERAPRSGPGRGAP